MNFATKISLVLAITVPLLFLGYSVLSAPAFAAEGSAPAAGIGQARTVSAQSLDAGLMTAVGVGDMNRVQEFLDRGANPNAKNARGFRLLPPRPMSGMPES